MAFDGTLKFDTAIDQTGFESGLDKLGSLAEKGMAAVEGVARAAASEMWTLGQSAIEAGKGFESSMSQVIATMGITKDTIQDGTNSYDLLKKAAADAGESTTFSASEAADALNYLALAGYSATQAADALPAVLNLAAAGGMNLGYASDLATDAMAALGIEATKDNLTHFGDELAKTASKANASVSQLGEAILTVGGTAKSLANGTTELNSALGVLANRGIKGSEGGTALRNMILSLSAPTTQAAEAMERLGLDAVDANGNLRPLNEIFKDLNASLDGLGGTQKDRILNEIFNKVDLKSVNALLAGCGEEFDNLTAELLQCDGAMAQMAETMNDTLEGDIKSFGSKTEALGIAIYDAVNEPLREIVQLGGDYVSQLTNAFKEGGFEGLAAELGKVLGQAVTKFTEYLPDIAKLGNSVIISFLDGLTRNADSISENLSAALIQAADVVTKAVPNLSTAGIKLIASLATGVSKAAPDLMKSVSNGLKNAVSGIMQNLPDLAVAGLTIADTLISGIAGNIPDIISTGEQLLTQFADTIQKKAPRFRRLGREILKAVTESVSENLPALTEAILKIIDFAVSLLTDSENFSGFVNAAVSILLALADRLINSIPVLIEKAPEIVAHLEKALEENADLIKDTAAVLLDKLGESLKEAKDSIKSKAPEIMQNVVDALKNAPLAVGSVADSVITAIADALGVGDKWQSVKEKVKEVLESDDLKTIKMNLKLAFEDVPDDIQQNFENVSTTFSDASDRLKTSFDNLKQSFDEKFQPVIDKLKEYFASGQAGKDAGEGIETSITAVSGAVAVAADAVSKLFSGIMDFVAWLTEGSSGADAFSASVIGIVTAVGTFTGALKLISIVKAAVTGLTGSATALWAVITANPLVALIAVLAGLSAALVHVMKNSEEWQIGWQMLKDTFQDFKDAWKTGWKDIKEKWEDFWDSWKVGEDALKKFGENIFDFVEGAKQWGKDLISNFIGGVKESWNDWENAWEGVGEVIYDLLHHTHPDKGLLKDDYTWMPDMMQSFAEGIEKNIPLVKNQAEALTDSLKSAFENAVVIETDLIEPEVFALPEIETTQKIELIPEMSEISDISENELKISAPETAIQIQTPELILDTPELPEIENPELVLDAPELPEIENPELVLDAPELPEIENPELVLDTPELPEIENPELVLDTPELLEIENPELVLDAPELPEIENPELTLNAPELDAPELKIPEIENPELILHEPEIKIPEMPSVDVPELDFNIPEIPDFRLPEISPEVLKTFQMQSMRMPEFLTKPDAVSSVVNNHYSYTTTNTNQQNISQNQPSGDIIIPVYIGGQQIETLVISAIQIENARSGGRTV